MIKRLVKWTLIVVAILFVLLFALGGNPWLIEMVFRLVVGWFRFLKNIVPKIGVSGDGVAMLAVCLVLAGAIGHGFCRWLWRSTGHEVPWRPRWTIAGLAVVVLMFAAGMAFTGVAHQTGWLIRSPEPLTRTDGGNERNASSSLKTIASAQADFRSNDRDENGQADFLCADIAGLYATKGKEGQPIRLIEPSIALADDRPATDLAPYGTRSPKGGYWYRALRYREEKTPDPSRFAVVAFPGSRAAGFFMFVLNEDNTVYMKDAAGGPPEFFPADLAKDGWTKLD